jgi:hypothetical protein
MRYEELMSGLIRFGRENVHDFIIRSHDVNDAVTYLWVELGFDLARVSSFETTNLVTFVKNDGLRYGPYQAKTQAYPPIP